MVVGSLLLRTFVWIFFFFFAISRVSQNEPGEQIGVPTGSRRDGKLTVCVTWKLLWRENPNVSSNGRISLRKRVQRRGNGSCTQCAKYPAILGGGRLWLFTNVNQISSPRQRPRITCWTSPLHCRGRQCASGVTVTATVARRRRWMTFLFLPRLLPSRVSTLCFPRELPWRSSCCFFSPAALHFALLHVRAALLLAECYDTVINQRLS